MKNYQSAIDYEQLEDIVKDGPSLQTCSDSGETPPYLNDNWWYNN